jgi:predicted nucleic acid-binding protein
LILYLETSSLVKLYVREKDSETVRGCVEASEAVATSVLAYAEARAAFARKLREQGITKDAHEAVKRALAADWPSVFVLYVTAGTARLAGDLAEKHALRGFDALHLASAAELRAAGAGDIRFSSADERLRAAARAEGFEAA